MKTLKNKRSAPVFVSHFPQIAVGCLHSLPTLPASGLFLHQSGLDFAPQEGCSGGAAGGQQEEGQTGHVDRQGTVALQEDLLPPLVVQEDGLQLGKRANGQKYVEELMPVAHNVTGPGEVLLRNRAREEVGADQEEEDLEGVVPGGLLLAASQVA